MARSQTIIREAGGTTGNLFNVPLDRLRANPRNIRLDTPEFRAKLNALADDITDNGFDRSQVLRIRHDESEVGYFIVESGNRRLLACRIACERGTEIVSLPCVMEADGMTEEKRLANIVLDGEREDYTAAEYAVVIRRYQSWGWTDSDIAKRLRKSRQWIDNVLETAAMPEEVQALVVNGAVSATTARQLVRSEGAGAASHIARVVSETGRARVTARHLRVVEATPEPATPPPASVESTPDPVRLHLAPAEPERDGCGEGASVDTSPLVEPDLTLAVRRLIAAWDDPDSGQVGECIAALRRLVA